MRGSPAKKERGALAFCSLYVLMADEPAPPLSAALEDRGGGRVLHRDRCHGPAARLHLFRERAAAPSHRQAYFARRRLAARARHYAHSGAVGARLTEIAAAVTVSSAVRRGRRTTVRFDCT